MGLSKSAFTTSKGFGKIHPGEDPDLAIRLWKLGYDTKLLPEAHVFHKRRIDWNKFYIQVNKFGKARPILNFWHPEFAKITFWFPSFFLLGFLISVFLALFDFTIFIKFYLGYFLVLFFVALIQTKNSKIAFYSLIATLIQFTGYGVGFLKSYFKIFILKQEPQVAFPKLFFND
jgi:GT2 family glycosyltransferase